MLNLQQASKAFQSYTGHIDFPRKLVLSMYQRRDPKYTYQLHNLSGMISY